MMILLTVTGETLEEGKNEGRRAVRTRLQYHGCEMMCSLPSVVALGIGTP